MTSPGARLLWLDLARGLAVVSMVIAHTAPWGGVFVGTEYLTAPWFAMLVGISLLLAWDKTGGGTGAKSGARSGEQTPSRTGAFIAANVARGLLLLLAGELLQRAYWQIDVVLQTLGLLTIVLAPLVVLVGRRRWVWAAISAAMVAASPLLMDAARELAAREQQCGRPGQDASSPGCHGRAAGSPRSWRSPRRDRGDAVVGGGSGRWTAWPGDGGASIG